MTKTKDIYLSQRPQRTQRGVAATKEKMENTTAPITKNNSLIVGATVCGCHPAGGHRGPPLHFFLTEIPDIECQ
jgi:hypothetical protein